MDERTLFGEDADKLREQVKLLVERWKYLLGLWWNIDIVIVKTGDPSLGCVDASIYITGQREAKLEIVMIERQHPYVLEKHVVHELLHLPNIELEYKLEKEIPPAIWKRIEKEVRKVVRNHDEAMVIRWAETLVCLAHGFYPKYGAPPQDDFFDPSRRIPLDLRIWRDPTGEYKSSALKVPISKLQQIYDNYKMSGLL